MVESITPKGDEDGGISACSRELEPPSASASRKDKRKAAKKEKRKQIRKELAEKARAVEEARLNDPEEQTRIRLEEERERERLERERNEFEEREKLFLQELARKKAEEEEAVESRKALEEEIKQNQACLENKLNEDDEWEYVEEGPPEIIWKGNEIIVKKNRVKVKKKDTNHSVDVEDPNRPTSNPLPPQSEAYASYKDPSKPSAQQLLENVAQQVPNFGTEQDKAHCPFHIKTGACRFGLRCSRVHFYPDKSCTLLIKNMYTGPGLAWEQDEGLEIYSFSQALHRRFMVLALGGLEIKRHKQFCTDEEVERCFEEFYEDVHTEFLKFGEIVNFKVCRNGSFHLRGNVYVHYKSIDSAVLAYQSVNGRYFAGKQVNCEFVSLTKWKVAICGEYMKSRMKSCSRGTACNFLHCFRNLGGDYEWADWDRPPPRYWVKEMTALFGYSDESWYDRDQQMEQESPRERERSSSRIFAVDRERYQSRRYRSRSREADQNGSYDRSQYTEHDARKGTYQKRHTSDHRKRLKSGDEKDFEEETKYGNNQHLKKLSSESDSDGGWLRRAKDRDVYHSSKRRRSRNDISKTGSRDFYVDSRNRTSDSGSGEDWSISDSDVDSHHNGTRRRSNHRKEVPELSDVLGEVNHSELDVERARNLNHSRRGHSSLETSEVSVHEEHIKSSGHQETNNSGKYQKRAKRNDIDSRYNFDEDVDKAGHRETEYDSLPGKHKRSRRKLNIDENVMLDNAHRYHERSKPHYAECYCDEYNEERDRWKPDESIPEKDHRKSRRLLGDDCESHWQTGSRSRRSHWSSHERRLDSLKGVDSAEETQKSEKDNKKGSREKRRSHNHNRNVEAKTRTENQS